MIKFFINGKIVDFSTWWLARKLCKQNSIFLQIRIHRGISIRSLIQLWLNCDEDLLLKCKIGQKRYVFDYYTSHEEHFCIDDLLTGKFHIFTQLKDIVTFVKTEGLKLNQIKNEDSGGYAWKDFVKEMNT